MAKVPLVRRLVHPASRWIETAEDVKQYVHVSDPTLPRIETSHAEIVQPRRRADLSPFSVHRWFNLDYAMRTPANRLAVQAEITGRIWMLPEERSHELPVALVAMTLAGVYHDEHIAKVWLPEVSGWDVEDRYRNIAAIGVAQTVQYDLSAKAEMAYTEWRNEQIQAAHIDNFELKH